MSSRRSLPSKSSRIRAVAWSVCLVGLLFSSPGLAEIYKWKDAEGRLHFAQDLGQVPARYRRRAKADAQTRSARPEIQHYDAAPAARSPRRRSASSASRSGAGRVYRIQVMPTGNSMRVNVRLNGDVVAPFMIDTGATDVVLPESVAHELGVDLESARTQYYRTANGMVESRVIVLDSVELGGARVEHVPASVSKSMRVGLLGLSFFNHFRYRIDPAAGIVTLEDNGMAESGAIRGGRSEAQWRNEYRRLVARRDAIQTAIDESSTNGSRRRAKIQAALDEAERQIDVLDDEADEARVPMRWRD